MAGSNAGRRWQLWERIKGTGKSSNTCWDWQINHVEQIYGAMDDVFAFTATFKVFPPRLFPPRLFPPSFVPTTVMEDAMEAIKDARQKAAGGR
jgi:hypothetical protein